MTGGQVGGEAVEICFDIGTMLRDCRAWPAAVVKDRAATVADIAMRRAAPLPLPASIRELLQDWERWHDRLRELDLPPSPEDGWLPPGADDYVAGYAFAPARGRQRTDG
jgi:hypothetical protein